tara:strand:+ start:4272 stop:4658 length:387 start_codon:yes stop_codon:yes gene_type:complete
MKKLLLVLFLCSLTSNALAEERMMTCGSEGIFKYVKKLIFKDKVYKRYRGEWKRWCTGDNRDGVNEPSKYYTYKARQYSASCKHWVDSEKTLGHTGSPTLDFIALKYRDYRTTNEGTKKKNISCKVIE